VTGGSAGESLDAVVSARSLSRSFGPKVALDDVGLEVREGELHALLGPNGAGKTTLIRILLGLLEPTGGAVELLGREVRRHGKELGSLVGLVPSGDRSFYLRISGLENLVFFARMQGMTRRRALERSYELFEHVGLAGAAKERVGVYSHGMQKRPSVARALLGEPKLLLVDGATHDLHPDGAERVRNLVRLACARCSAVVWATQRLEEIRGLADRVTLLHRGRVEFVGSVHELSVLARPREHVLRLTNGHPAGPTIQLAAQAALLGRATLVPAGGDDIEHYVLSLDDGVVLGDALALFPPADVKVLACRERRSEIEDAFLSLTREELA
jgi:ABC-type multidrug transport system ATPase subunit